MSEQNLIPPEDDTTGFEAFLGRFRPGNATGSLEETLYQAGWRAAEAQRTSALRTSSKKPWQLFAGGIVCGMLPMLLLFVRYPSYGPAVSDRPSESQQMPTSLQSPGFVRSDDSIAGDDPRGSDQRSPLNNFGPAKTAGVAESITPQRGLSELPVVADTSRRESVLHFRPLGSDDFWLADAHVRSSREFSGSSEFHDAEQPELLSLRSFASTNQLLDELSL